VSENNSTEYEHRLKQTEAQSDGQTEHEAGQSASAAHDFNPSTLLDPAVGSSVNSSARATAMLNGQRAHGNRAVQRFLQRTVAPASNSNMNTRAVQRFHRPDEDWLANTLESGQGMAGGMLGAIPIVGNVLNASMASVYTAGSAINYATGHEDDAKRSMGYAQNSLLNAIPIYGNIRSGAQGVHDAGAFYENMFGSGPAPAEISRDIYARDSAPIMDRYLSSLF
jgi:hypothetical protein